LNLKFLGREREERKKNQIISSSEEVSLFSPFVFCPFI
jgi:hypothetical protein